MEENRTLPDSQEIEEIEEEKRLLEEEGEVSDALGRLTDRVYYDTLSYEEKQRYTMQLSNKYLKALEKYRKEKEIGI